jgi:hypothetical protein
MRGKMIGRREEAVMVVTIVSQKMRGERYYFWRSIYKKRLQIVKFGNLLNKSLVKSMRCPQNQSMRLRETAI